MSPLQSVQSVKVLSESHTHICGTIGVLSYNQTNFILHRLFVILMNKKNKNMLNKFILQEKKKENEMENDFNKM